jgi:hypothetical protein
MPRAAVVDDDGKDEDAEDEDEEDDNEAPEVTVFVIVGRLPSLPPLISRWPLPT